MFNSRRIQSRSLAARLLAGGLGALTLGALAGCGGGGGTAPARAWVGQIDGSPALIGIVSSAGHVQAYLCDSARLAEWFTATPNGNKVDATTAGDRLTATLGSHATGSIRFTNGETMRFSIGEATGDAGLYRAKKTVAGERFTVGWVVADNGAEQGDVTNDGGATTDTASGATTDNSGGSGNNSTDDSGGQGTGGGADSPQGGNPDGEGGPNGLGQLPGGDDAGSLTLRDVLGPDLSGFITPGDIAPIIGVEPPAGFDWTEIPIDFFTLGDVAALKAIALEAQQAAGNTGAGSGVVDPEGQQSLAARSPQSSADASKVAASLATPHVLAAPAPTNGSPTTGLTTNFNAEAALRGTKGTTVAAPAMKPAQTSVSIGILGNFNVLKVAAVTPAPDKP